MHPLTIGIYSYHPHDVNQPDLMSKFTCALADDFTLENLILYETRDGMAADTSWHNKSENQAAVTFLIAVDENEHLVPGRALRIVHLHFW